MQGHNVSLPSTTTQQGNVYTPPHPLKQLGIMGSYIFRAMTGAYGMSVSGFLILRLLISEDIWSGIAFFNSFVHILILPAVILFPIVVVFWRRELMLLTIAPFASFMLWYAPTFVNNPPDDPGTAQLTLVTHNIASYRVDSDALSALILETDADVILIQELGESAAAFLTETLAEAYPYQALYPHISPVRGQGVLSRYPILEDSVIRPYAFYQQRVLLDVDGQEIVVYNVHISNPFAGSFVARHNDMSDLLARVNAETLPVIIGGDFNLTEHAADYARFSDHYVDAYRQASRGFGWTFAPSSRSCVRNLLVCQLARIDYVFHDEAITALEAEVWSSSANSDHYPVWVRLALPQ